MVRQGFPAKTLDTMHITVILYARGEMCLRDAPWLPPARSLPDA